MNDGRPPNASELRAALNEVRRLVCRYEGARECPVASYRSLGRLNRSLKAVLTAAGIIVSEMIAEELREDVVPQGEKGP